MNAGEAAKIRLATLAAILVLLLIGCVTSHHPQVSAKPAIEEVPFDRALVYIYHENHIAGRGPFLIFQDDKPIVVLHSGEFCALNTAPGNHNLKFRLHVRFTGLPGADAAIKSGFNDGLETNFEAGKTYYFRLRVADVWTPHLESMSESKAKEAIAKCKRGI